MFHIIRFRNICIYIYLLLFAGIQGKWYYVLSHDAVHPTIGDDAKLGKVVPARAHS